MRFGLWDNCFIELCHQKARLASCDLQLAPLSALRWIKEKQEGTPIGAHQDTGRCQKHRQIWNIFAFHFKSIFLPGTVYFAGLIAHMRILYVTLLLKPVLCCILLFILYVSVYVWVFEISFKTLQNPVFQCQITEIHIDAKFY